MPLKIMPKLKKSPKGFTQGQDKALTPLKTIEKVSKALEDSGKNILKNNFRVDSGRLGIPVYMSVCSSSAREILSSRKQMGKGSTPEQAQASALMELVERYSLFSFMKNMDNFQILSWREAKEKFGPKLIEIQKIKQSVQDKISDPEAEEILDLISWEFCPALDVQREETVWLPFNWFYKLNEFNGSSAGNTLEESILQGFCEVIERHVCSVIDINKPVLPSLDPSSFSNPQLKQLWNSFADKKIQVWLKDFTLDMPVPTIGALAFDPNTFPQASEIVFTAGTASDPEKAAIRALTEVAQLAGDFEGKSRYEASGLSKYKDLAETDWIRAGKLKAIQELPSLSKPDFLQETKAICNALALQNYYLYSVDLTHPEYQIPASYNIVPGFFFRQRSQNASLGLFVGRILAEEAPISQALSGLQILEKIYPDSAFCTFFQGLCHLRLEDLSQAKSLFFAAQKKAGNDEELAMSCFYTGYIFFQEQNWPNCLEQLNQALKVDPENQAYYNLRGATLFKLKDYHSAAQDFQSALDLDQGSAVDLANLGLCYKFMHKYKTAYEYLAKSLEMDPSLDFAQRHLAEIIQNNSHNPNLQNRVLE